MTTLTKLFIYPPLAFARLGPSPTPLDAYTWGPNDDTAEGTGKTTIAPAESLDVAEDGAVARRTPETIVFKDGHGFRPVCPFFELWGTWEEAPNGAPITPEVLDRLGIPRSRLQWSVDVANLKPFFITQDPGARITGHLDLAGDRTQRTELVGVGPDPDQAAHPLVPRGRHIKFGWVQLTNPAADDVFRLRFTPGAGRFYGPTDFKQRWPGVELPDEQLILDPRSPWCGWKPGKVDPRGWPPGQYAANDAKESYGLVDDVCDGLIRCRIDGLEAVARVVVAPPDYAPDRRHVLSLADGLKDRMARAEVFSPEYTRDMDLLGDEVHDLMERVLETLGLMNLDVFNDRVDKVENQLVALDVGVPYTPGANRPFQTAPPTPNNPLPLTALGRLHHRRYAVRAVFVDFVRKHPDHFMKLVRPPFAPEPFFDARMPALMKDAGDTPLTLTPRQYEVLRQWVLKLKASVEGL